MDGFLIVKFLILTAVVSGVIIFFLHRTLIASTSGSLQRLNTETEAVRAKQAELNQKIKEAGEELQKRKREAQEVVNKMTQEAEGASQREREKIIQKARAEAEEIIAKAQARREDIRKALEKEMELKTIDRTVEILNKVLSQKTKGAFDHQLMMEFLDSLEEVDPSPVSKDIPVAEIFTAQEMEASLKERMRQIIEKKFSRPIQLNFSVDSKIIGGAILKFGSLQLDASLRTLIRQTAMALKEDTERSLVR